MDIDKLLSVAKVDVFTVMSKFNEQKNVKSSERTLFCHDLRFLCYRLIGFSQPNLYVGE